MSFEILARLEKDVRTYDAGRRVTIPAGTLIRIDPVEGFAKAGHVIFGVEPDEFVAFRKGILEAVLDCEISFTDFAGKAVRLPIGTTVVVDVAEGIGAVGELHFDILPFEYRSAC